MNHDPHPWLRLFATNCAFVLLIVFLVIFVIMPLSSLAPLLFEPLESTTAIKSPEQYGDLTITVTADDRLFLGDANIELSELHSRILAARGSGDLDPAVRIRVGRNVSFGAVRAIVLAAQDAGYPRVTFLFRHRAAETSIDNSLDGWSLAPTSQLRAILPALAVAAFAFLAAIAITAWRPRRPSRPGCLVWLLLLVAVLALVVAWETLFSSCPPGYWC